MLLRGITNRIAGSTAKKFYLLFGSQILLHTSEHNYQRTTQAEWHGELAVAILSKCNKQRTDSHLRNGTRFSARLSKQERPRVVLLFFCFTSKLSARSTLLQSSFLVCLYQQKQLRLQLPDHMHAQPPFARRRGGLRSELELLRSTHPSKGDRNSYSNNVNHTENQTYDNPILERVEEALESFLMRHCRNMPCSLEIYF